MSSSTDTDSIQGRTGDARHRWSVRQQHESGDGTELSASVTEGGTVDGDPAPEPVEPAAPDLSVCVPEPYRHFRKPSEALAAVYKRLDESLADQLDAATELAEARRNLEDARRWLEEAESRRHRSSEDVRSLTEEMREVELVEPCEWRDMYEQLKRFREEFGHADPCRPWSDEGRRFTKRKMKQWREKKRIEEEERLKKEEAKKKEEEKWNSKDPEGVTKVYDSDGEEQEVGDETKNANEAREEQLDESDNEREDDGNEKYAQLGIWVTNYRSKYKREGLQSRSPHRVRALEQLGMLWDLQEAKWHTRYAELLQYKEIHGHVNVPQNYQPNLQLARWVHRQRLDRENLVRGRKDKPQIQPERLRLMEEAGIKWCERPRTWEDRYSELCDFVSKYGHANVPHAFEENPQLWNWVDEMRKLYAKQLREGPRKGRRLTLTDRRIKMLDSQGFQWLTQF